MLKSILLFSTVLASEAFLNSCPKPFALNHLNAQKKKSGDGDLIEKAPTSSVGTFVEFSEKSRIHVGKIVSVEHKANGGARYTVVDDSGKQFDISEKAISFSMPTPNSPGAAGKLFSEFVEAQTISESDLREKLDVSPLLVEMVWEECANTEESDDMVITPKRFIELIHAHTASAIETYLAWRLLKADMAHVFFKEMKQNGRIVSFKAKAKKAVDAAKITYCSAPEHDSDWEFCFV